MFKKSKKPLSLLLSLIMIFSIIVKIKSPYSYADENENWVKKVEVSKTTMESKKISFAIDYLGEQNKDDIKKYISGFKFYLNEEEVFLTPESKMILDEKTATSSFMQDSRLELEINIPENMQLESINSLNLKIVPLIKKESTENIEIIKNFKENGLNIALSDEEYSKYENSYNSLSDEKKKEFLKYLTDNQDIDIIPAEKLRETIDEHLTKKLSITLNEKEEIKNKISSLQDKINLQKNQGKVLIKKSEVEELKLSINSAVSDSKNADISQIDNLLKEYSKNETTEENQINSVLENQAEQEMQTVEENTQSENTQNNEQEALSENQTQTQEQTLVVSEENVPLSLSSSNLENTVQVYEIEETEAENIAIVLENATIESPRVSIVRTNQNEIAIYPRETMIFTVHIDNAQLNSTIENSYLSIKVPTQHLLKNTHNGSISSDSIVVSKTAAMKQNPIITHNVDGSEYSEIKIFLEKLDKTTSVSFPINIKVNPRLTPEGYALTPTLDMYLKNQSNQEVKLLSKVQGKDNDASVGTIFVKYESMQLYKSVASKINFDDKSFVYAGGLDANSFIMQNSSQDIDFFYSLTTTNPNVSYTYYKDNNLPLPKGVQLNQTYGIGLQQVRLHEELIVTETLPKYIKTDGSVAIAKFEQAKNIGWEAIEENGVVTKVKYIVRERADKTAERILEDELKLTLSFPDFKAMREQNFEDINALLREAEKYKYESSTEIELVAKGESEQEKNNRNIISDKLKYTLTGHGFFGAGMFSKRHIGTTLDVDNGAMHLITSDYNVSLINKQAYPIDKLVIKDVYDTRYFVKHIKWNQTTNNKDIAMNRRLMEGFDGIYGIKHDGSEEKLNTSIDDMKFYGKSNQASVDETTQARVMEKVTEFKRAQENGNHIDISSLQVQGQYKSVEFRMKPDFKFQPGDYIDLVFQMGFTHPYGLAEDIDKTTYKYLKNTASVDGEMVVDNNTKISLNDKLKDEASSLLKLKTFKSSMVSQTVENKSGSVGEKIYFSIKLDLANMPKLQIYENPYLIVMLPEGISPQDDANKNIGETYVSANSPDRGLLEEFLEDGQVYKVGSGLSERLYFDKNRVKQANIDGKRVLIFDLKGFALENISKNQTIEFNIFGKINDKSIPNELINKIPDANTVHTFFFANNLSKNVELTDSPNVKEDKFGIIDMLKAQGLVSPSVTENKLLTTSTRYNATLPTEIRSEKWIGSQKAYEKQENWKKEDDVLDTQYNEKFYYKIVTKNYSMLPLSKLMIYDILPYQNDKVGTTFARNSGFANILLDEIEVVGDKSKFDIYYYVGSDMPSKNPKTHLDTNNKWKIDNTNWTKNPANYADVKAVFIMMKEGSHIEPLTTQEFIIHMKTPDNSSNISGKMANNEFFVFNDRNNSFGQSNYVINRLSDSKIKILYKELSSGETLLQEVILKGGVGENFDITNQNKDIEGYSKLGLINQNPSGKYQATEQVFTYYYRKIPTQNSNSNVPSVPSVPSTPIVPSPTPNVPSTPNTPIVPNPTPNVPSVPSTPSEQTPNTPSPTPSVPSVPSENNSQTNPPTNQNTQNQTPSVPNTPIVPNPTPNVPNVPSTPSEQTPNTPSPTPSVPSVPSENNSQTNPSTNQNSTNQQQEQTSSSSQDTNDNSNTPIRTVPSENPPTNVSFVPDRIVNFDRIPDDVQRPVLDIINEDDVPLGRAEIDKEDMSYTFIEEDITPLGKAKIYADNTLEILEDDIPLALPKTGQNDGILLYLFGMTAIVSAIILRKKYTVKK